MVIDTKVKSVFLDTNIISEDNLRDRVCTIFPNATFYYVGSDAYQLKDKHVKGCLPRGTISYYKEGEDSLYSAIEYFKSKGFELFVIERVNQIEPYQTFHQQTAISHASGFYFGRCEDHINKYNDLILELQRSPYNFKLSDKDLTVVSTILSIDENYKYIYSLDVKKNMRNFDRTRKWDFNDGFGNKLFILKDKGFYSKLSRVSVDYNSGNLGGAVSLKFKPCIIA